MYRQSCRRRWDNAATALPVLPQYYNESEVEKSKFTTIIIIIISNSCADPCHHHHYYYTNNTNNHYKEQNKQRTQIINPQLPPERRQHQHGIIRRCYKTLIYVGLLEWTLSSTEHMKTDRSFQSIYRRQYMHDPSTQTNSQPNTTATLNIVGRECQLNFIAMYVYTQKQIDIDRQCSTLTMKNRFSMLSQRGTHRDLNA